LSSTLLTAEPDARERSYGNADGDKESDNGHADEIDRGWGAEAEEAVQQHCQNEKLDKKKGDAPRPRGLVRLLDRIARRRVARERIVRRHVQPEPISVSPLYR
jgi:hypothetical protein